MNPSHPDINAPRQSVLFVVQDASRTGAPIQLLHLLRWLKAEGSLNLRVVLLRGGELAGEFRAVCPVITAHFPGMGTLVRLMGSKTIFRPLTALLHMAVRGWLNWRKIDLIYNNGIANGWALDLFGTAGRPVLTHVHELRYSVEMFMGRNAYDPIRRHTRRYLAVSEAVGRELIEDMGISSDQIDLVRGFVPDKPTPPLAASRITDSPPDLPPNARIVVACGQVVFAKGADLFLLLAREISRRRPDEPIHFVWVGQVMPNGIGPALVQDARKLGLASRVHFVGVQKNPSEWFARADVFVLPSRDESMSLVLLEAAREGVPAVCFDKTGGPSEFIEDDCGFVVPYLDVSAMADAVLKTLDSTELRMRLGEAARSKVSLRHHVDVAGPVAIAAIRKCAGAVPKPRPTP